MTNATGDTCEKHRRKAIVLRFIIAFGLSLGTCFSLSDDFADISVPWTYILPLIFALSVGLAVLSISFRMGMIPAAICGLLVAECALRLFQMPAAYYALGAYFAIVIIPFLLIRLPAENKKSPIS